MSRRGWVLFAVMSVIWGIPYLMIKVAVEEVSVPMVVFARTAISAAVLLPLALRGGGGQLRELRPYWRPLLAFAVIEMIIPWWLLSDAERRISSSMAGLIIAAVPVLAVIMSRLIGDTERLSTTRWVGLAVGFAGVAVLVSPELGAGGDTWAVVEVLLVALGYAIAPLIAAHWLKDVAALPMIAVCLGLAAVLYTPAAILTWPDTVPSTQVLHRHRVHRVLRADPRGRPGPRGGVYLRQPGRCGRRRGGHPRRTAHRSDHRVVRPDPGRLAAGDHPATRRGATRGTGPGPRRSRRPGRGQLRRTVKAGNQSPTEGTRRT